MRIAFAAVQIEPTADDADDRRQGQLMGQQNSLRLRWSFGRSFDSVRSGYTIEPLFDASTSGPGAARVIPLRVTFAGASA